MTDPGPDPATHVVAQRWCSPTALLLAAVIGCGVALRCWHAGSEPFWTDEAYSAYFADHGLWFLWHVVPRFETHPPTYYTLLWGWNLVAGRTVLARRLLGLLFGFGTIALTAAAARALGRLLGTAPRQRRWLWMGAAALSAIHPLLIDMSRQVRTYPVMCCVYAGTILALFRLADAVRACPRLPRGWLLAFFTGEAAMLWLHDLGALFALPLSLSLLLLIAGRGLPLREWAAAAAAQLLVALLYLPAMILTLRQETTWAAGTWLRFDPLAALQDLGGLFITWSMWACLAALLLAVAGFAQMARQPTGRRLIIVLLLLAVLPPSVSYAVSWLKTPIFLTRTLSPAAVPAILAIASAALCAPRVRIAAAAFAAALMLITLRVDVQLRALGPQQDWYPVVAWLNDHVKPGDALWSYPNETDLPLSYALRDKHDPLRSVPIPGPVPTFDAQGWIAGGNKGVVSLYPEQMARLVRSPAWQTPGTIWLVECRSEIYDPRGDMKAALARTRVMVADRRWGPIEVIGFAKPLSPGRAGPAAAAARR